MAHKKGQGSSRNGRDSNSQRLGVKRFGGEQVKGGTIILRQHGTRWKAGKGVGLAKDHSPRGGPDGGVGGGGGDVVLQAVSHHNTLLSLRYHTEYRAQRGEHGGP